MADSEIQDEAQRPIRLSLFQTIRRDPHWKCLLLSVLISTCVLAILWCYVGVTIVQLTRSDTITEFSVTRNDSQELSCQSDYMYIPVAFLIILYVLYLVECWHCQSQIQLPSKTNVHLVYDHINSIKDAVPIVWWKAVCYHYLRRTRQVTRYRNGDAFTSTQVYYERINSHTACSMYNFSSDGVKDISKQLVSLESHPITKITISKRFSFATVESESEFEDQRAQFFQEHERKDDYMETREGLDLMNIGWKAAMTVCADPARAPWYISRTAYWMMSVVLLSWPLRILIQYNTAYVHYQVNKLFGCEDCALGTHNSYQNQMTRVSTMDSIILESAIRNNNSMVPSYSEAMLMNYTRSPPSQRGATSSSTIDVRGHRQRSDSSNTCPQCYDGHPPPYDHPSHHNFNKSISDYIRPVRLKPNATASSLGSLKELTPSDNRLYTSCTTEMLTTPRVKYSARADYDTFRPAVVICSPSRPRCICTSASNSVGNSTSRLVDT